MTRDVVKQFGLDSRIADKTKNQFVAGILFWLFNRDLKIGEAFLQERFKNKPELIEANLEVLRAGYNYAETVEAIEATYQVKPAEKGSGLYRNITGNIATALGFVAAAVKSGTPESWSGLNREEQDLHLKAQRFARVQVAEMRLYKAQAVRNGRSSRDLYASLKVEIDSGRDAFRRQFVDKSKTMVDYFHLELVRTLANDDVALLGPEYPGPLMA